MISDDHEVGVRKRVPSPGLHIRNIKTGEVFEGLIYLAKSQNDDELEEITHEEYERIFQEQIDEYNAQFEQGGDQVEN